MRLMLRRPYHLISSHLACIARLQLIRPNSERLIQRTLTKRPFTGMSNPTLIRPPPYNDSMSSMENTLELTQLSDIDPNLFTNTRPLWHPPGARGVYGGAVIAQCLAAAQKTVPSTFSVHSMHCYFVLAGNSEIPIIYHVERVRDGKSFITRTVQARQRAKPIFTVTLSFMRDMDPSEKIAEHTTPMPEVGEPNVDSLDLSRGPFESRYVKVKSDPSKPYLKRTRMWLRTRGTISKEGGHEAHLSALSYMSDSFFIGTIARAHRLFRNFMPPEELKKREESKRDNSEDYASDNEKSTDAARDQEMAKRIKDMNGGHTSNVEKRPEIGMMVSLDHTIYFHRPRDFRADEWLLSEMETPWAGNSRGLVMQRIWTKDGALVATCIQEGLVRLKQDGPGSKL